MSTTKTGTVYLVGAGPGDPGLLTVRALHLLRSADALLYDALADETIVAMAPQTCERTFVGKRSGEHAMPQSEIEALLIRLAREGKRVVRLKGGDPFIFGRGGEEAQALAENGIPFEIVPGVSSAFAAPAYAGIPLTHREHNPSFTVVTGHEDPAKAASTLDFAKLADPNRTLVFLMAMANLEQIAAQLQRHGLAGDTPVAVIQEGTRPSQRTVVGSLATIASDVNRDGLRAPAVVIVGSVVGLREQLRWFDSMPLFGVRVLVTRPAAQAHEFAEGLLARGAQPIVAPTIAIVPPSDDAPAREALAELGTFAWVVFSSRNAVDAAFAFLDEAGRDARAFAAVRIAAVGPQTALALERRGLHADLVPSEFIAEALALDLLAATLRGDDVLLLGPSETRPVLRETLEHGGRRVRNVAAYQTVPLVDTAIAQAIANADVLTFASASAVRGFVANVTNAGEAASGKVVACLGPATAHAACDAALHVDVAPSAYTTPALIDALEEYMASRR